MVPTIRVDDEVYRNLQQRAEPFVDTPNTVIRRLLLLPVARDDSSHGQVPSHIGPAKGRERAATGSILPHEAYVRPILRTLERAGGSAPASAVITSVGEDLRGELTGVDRAALRSGGIRWPNRVQWVRHRMVRRGLLARHSPRGIWEITPKGRNFLATEGAMLFGRN